MSPLVPKTTIRKNLLRARRALKPEARSNFSRRIVQQVLALPEWSSSPCIGIYLSLPDEVSTAGLVRAALATGKILAAPVVNLKTHSLVFRRFNNPDDLRPGPLGILQPINGPVIVPSQFDLLIIPGVGFDLNCHRLGYGQGFYDRFLPECPGFRLGLAFEVQLMASLPTTPQDQPMHRVLTEKRSLPV
ncbi:5-formyltetrahydrofolate cyclo-ligase [bacterium]|nr:5-formyltetrahydrofolate cyclo-ligase [bacterium]